jgi:CheY-like chemotaxis protein
MTSGAIFAPAVQGERTVPLQNASIMVVDDQPANLRLMEDMLKQQGYRVRSFPRGRLALAAAQQTPPDLILLDINMPDMDGYAVCEWLKLDPVLASIPVIFLSALNETEDKVKAFQFGGVDYITKPFQFEEVHARVETHLQLQHARRAERDLLENTLNKAILALAELVHLTGPVMSARTEAIRAIVSHMSARLVAEEHWQYDLAATLCLIGCISLPVEVFEIAYAGEAASPADKQMFRSHPENGARFLGNIPRLENVAEMIRCQQTVRPDSAPAGIAQKGACMLRIALELDRQMLQMVPYEVALSNAQSALLGFPQEMLRALEDYSPPKLAYEIKRLQISELRPSMIVEDNVATKDGNLMIIPRGTALSVALIERVRNFAKTRGIVEPIHVRVACAE